MITSQSAPQLQYAPAPPAYRRRWFRRVVWLAGFFGAVLSGMKWAPPVWDRFRLLYWQRQCLRYTAPEGQRICAEDPPYAGRAPPFVFASPDPPMLTAFRQSIGGSGTMSWGYGPVLFMHERRTTGGTRRLVVVRRTPPGARMSWDAPLTYEVVLVTPGGLWTPPSVDAFTQNGGPVVFGDGTPNAPLLQFFAGQIDPADESHFTIRFEQNGEWGLIDGWLKDDPRDANRPRLELQVRL